MKEKWFIPPLAAMLTSVLLALCLLALPAGAEELDSGTCGDELTWVLEEDGTLTISGTGAMTNWSDPEDVPWYDYTEDIKAAVMEDGITRIGRSAFEGCTGLTEISIPGSVTSIGSSAFEGCTGLESIILPDSLTSLESEVFKGCTALTEVSLPDSVTSIGNFAFEGCTGLESITLPDSLTSLGDFAFRNCTSLTSIAIPEGVSSIELGTFENCTSLAEVALPDSLTSIGSDAFEDCTSLTEIEIPEGVTSLGNSCFSGCDSLAEVCLPESLTSLGNSCFSGCDSLAEICLPENLTSLAEGLFRNCISLESITIPEGVATISNEAFSSCTGLTDIIFLGSAPEIGEDAFDQVTANAFYPEEDGSWTEEIMQDYGGTLTWVAYGEDTEDFAACTLSLYDGAEVLISETLSQGSRVDLDAYETPSKEGYTFAGWIDRDCTPVEGEIIIEADMSLFAAWTLEDKDSDEALLLSLNSGELSYDKASTTTMQIANEERNGIYFLSGSTLGFYSLDYYCYTLAYEFSSSKAYAEGNLLYVLDGDYSCVVYDLNRNTIDHTVTLENLESEESVSSITALGADPSGRLYVATRGTDYQLWLYSPEGELLSSTETDSQVYCFDGFDADTGYFFMETPYNWSYWGYSHYGHAVNMGIVEDNVISAVDSHSTVTLSIVTYSLDCLEYVCQNSYCEHQTGAAVLGGQYLVTTSVTFGRLQVLDLDTLTACLTISRSELEGSSIYQYDLGSIGVRAVYHEANDSIILYEEGRILNEYDPDTGEILSFCDTSYYVFNLLILGDQVIAIEKEDNQYYIEILDWSDPTELAIEAESDTMQVGESQQLSLSSDAGKSQACTWTSSDDNILSVTQEGLVSAWSEGEATITCSYDNSTLEAEYTIRVSGTPASSETGESLLLSGTVSNNISDNNISTYYSSTVNSYLYENEDGTLTRVEYLSGTGVLVEVIDPEDGSTVNSMTLDMELPIWGGFYSGEEYNFLVFGQMNTDEDDDVEVIRVVKYSKDWERINECSICGANTCEPFDAGSLRMAETSGNLYLYTCHSMYETANGVNHQANMTFVLDEDSMEVTDSYYDLMNISYGYVSHSFAQFIQTDGEYIYRVDLGDAAPRAVSITKTAVGDDVTDLTDYTYALSISGSSGANRTGVSIGGFELSTDNCLIAINSVDQDEDTYSAGSQRNICLLVTDQDSMETEEIWLTDYDDSDGITPRTPQLVKITDDQFLLLWEEYDSSDGSVITRMVTLNGDGVQTSAVFSSDIRLSDCQPIVTEDRIVTWYVTDGSSAVLYQIDPYVLAENSGYDACAQDDSCPISQFNDASPTAWYHDGVHFCLDEGLMNGTSSRTFEPSTATTRSMIVTILYRLAGEPSVSGTSSFTDVVSGSWYEDAVIWAEQTGIANGYDTGEFGVSDNVTREQTAAFFCRYAELIEGQDVSTAMGMAGYPDADEVSDWAYAELSWAVAEGLLTGQEVGGETFLAPGSDAMRSETATILMRFIQNVINE